ncbi:unnamed protein product [Spodoptera littoralis]|uniref:Uncharacterized protein n=1 Tax=Spodoptera littoralis TaxID=7109 RepID=A0A9P0ICX2_SPOLI|nr:unnamed protein product [Spodoptera littoralis]CAH1644693.1 unnamed protein product [Spodoptera littoralis]
MSDVPDLSSDEDNFEDDEWQEMETNDTTVITNINRVLWDDDKYYKPVEQDEWLMYDFDALTDKPSSPKTYHANVENGLVTLSEAHFSELQRTIQLLTQQLAESSTLLNNAKEDIKKMQDSMQTLVEGGNKNNIEVPTEANCVASVPLEIDDGYFSTYAHFGIHYDMLRQSANRNL